MKIFFFVAIKDAYKEYACPERANFYGTEGCMAKKVNKAELAKKYAKALLDEAIERNQTDTVVREIQQLDRLMSDSPEYKKLMTSQMIGSIDRKNGMALVAEKLELSELTRHFLGVLVENGRTSIFSEIVGAFIRLYQEYRGILQVSVVSALALNDQTMQHLTDVLKQTFGKEIRMDVKIDPDLIGGLTVQAGSLMADASVKTKLQKLNLVMKGVGI